MPDRDAIIPLTDALTKFLQDFPGTMSTSRFTDDDGNLIGFEVVRPNGARWLFTTLLFKFEKWIYIPWDIKYHCADRQLNALIYVKSETYAFSGAAILASTRVYKHEGRELTGLDVTLGRNIKTMKRTNNVYRIESGSDGTTGAQEPGAGAQGTDHHQYEGDSANGIAHTG